MKQYVIWHAKEPNFGFGDQPAFPAAYERVAVVKCESIDEVFRVTNHIDSDWTKNPEVITVIKNYERVGLKLLEKRPRSTSVGDVVEEFRPNGEKFRCAMAGWEKVA